MITVESCSQWHSQCGFHDEGSFKSVLDHHLFVGVQSNSAPSRIFASAVVSKDVIEVMAQ